MALRGGTTAQLARSAEERERINQVEAFENLLPQADARLTRYNQSINLKTFGFSIAGQPPVVGPFNVTDANLTAAMQLFNLAALRHWQAVRQGVGRESRRPAAGNRRSSGDRHAPARRRAAH